MSKYYVRAGQFLLVFALVLSLISLAPSQAGTITDDFESYSLGNINGQGGWSMTGPYDAEVVANTWGYSGFGAQSFRVSDAVTTGAFRDNAFTPSTNEAGETTAITKGYSSGPRETYFYGEFAIASAVPGAEQPGMHIQVSPDNGSGGRMSYVGIEDVVGGLHIFFYEYDTTDGSWPYTSIATVSRNVPHTIGIEMYFVEGPSNDIVNIYLDGALVLTGTSWEDYFRDNISFELGVPTVDSLGFYVRGTQHPANLGKGYVIDNVVVITAPGPIVATGSGLNLPEKIAQIKIDHYQAQPAYESPDGGVARTGDGTEIWLPHDWDGNFFDTYDVYATQTVDDRVWVQIFLGSETMVWVPLDQVTPLSYITD